MHTYFIGKFPFYLPECRKQDLLYQGCLAAAADSAYHAKSIQGKLYGNIFQVMLSRTFHFNRTVPFTNRFWRFNLHFTFKVFACQAFWVRDNLIVIPCCHDLATKM